VDQFAPPVLPPPLPEGRVGPDRRLHLLTTAFVVLVVANNIGSIFAPRMVKRNPELLVALSARIRHLLFALPAGINEVAYWSLGFARMLVAGLLCFAFGYWYGERGMSWLERQLEGQEPASFRWVRRGVDRAGWALLLAFPGSNLVCALVGLRRMAPRRFAVLLSLAVVIRLAWVRIAAEVFDTQLQTILRWIERYQWYLVVAFFAITVVQSSIKAARAERAKREP
jgi:hypothetical protein